MKKRAYLLLLVLALQGCSFAPKYCRPTLDTPTEWRQPVDEITTHSNECWWKEINDPNLDSLVCKALENNQDLQVAIARVDAFVAKLGIVRSKLYPQLSGVASADREKVSENAPFFSPGANPLTKDFSLILKATYELDIWGRIRNSSHAALEEVLSQMETQRTVILTLVTSVANAYIELLQFDQELFIIQETLISRQESYRLAKIRYDLGLTSYLPVDQSLSEVEASQADGIRLQTIIPLQEDLICTLIGKASEPIERSGELKNLYLPPHIPACIPSDLLCQRPDILAAEHTLQAANAQIGVAKANFFPQISLTSEYGSQSTELRTLLKGPSNLWQYGATILQEIFTGGRLTSALRLTEAKKRGALHQYLSTVLQAFQEVNDALITHKKSLENIAVQKKRVGTLGEYLKLSTLRYNDGQTDYLTVLDAQRQFFSAQIDYTKAKGSTYTTYINLYKAFGGSWIPALPSTNSECRH